MRLFSYQPWLVPVALALFLGCGKGGDSAAVTDAEPAGTAASPTVDARKTEAVEPAVQYVPQPSIYVNAVGPVPKPIVIVHTSAGDIQIELEMEKSPQTVLNVLDNYVRSGFYEQTIFHHVDAQSFVVGGGFTTELAQKETVSPIYNESNNGLSNVRGTIAMSRDPNVAHSATSQFLINVVDNPGLDYQGEGDDQRGYCVFGRVIEGMDVVEKIAASEAREQGDFQRLPVDPITISAIEELP